MTENFITMPSNHFRVVERGINEKHESSGQAKGAFLNNELGIKEGEFKTVKFPYSDASSFHMAVAGIYELHGRFKRFLDKFYPNESDTWATVGAKPEILISDESAGMELHSVKIPQTKGRAFYEEHLDPDNATETAESETDATESEEQSEQDDPTDNETTETPPVVEQSEQDTDSNGTLSPVEAASHMIELSEAVTDTLDWMERTEKGMNSRFEEFVSMPDADWNSMNADDLCGRLELVNMFQSLYDDAELLPNDGGMFQSQKLALREDISKIEAGVKDFIGRINSERKRIADEAAAEQSETDNSEQDATESETALTDMDGITVEDIMTAFDAKLGEEFDRHSEAVQELIKQRNEYLASIANHSLGSVQTPAKPTTVKRKAATVKTVKSVATVDKSELPYGPPIAYKRGEKRKSLDSLTDKQSDSIVSDVRRAFQYASDAHAIKSLDIKAFETYQKGRALLGRWFAFGISADELSSVARKCKLDGAKKKIRCSKGHMSNILCGKRWCMGYDAR